MMSIYLDTCCLQRPLDDQRQPRIRVETEAVLAILAMVQAGEATMVTSDALEYEIGRIPDESRRHAALELLSLAGEQLTITEAVEHKAETLERKGIHAMDALHLALASEYRIHRFTTTDDALLRKARRAELQCIPLSVFELLLELAP